eukprot:m.203963 g.203963  ORF g.203963 m.203963 type:complete len:216 (+) comp39635_c0_seq7:123-770(+)
MENFVLYEELQRGDNSVTYKGRRKGTIEFSAIQCWEKSKKDEVVNSVRVLFAMDHPNVVQFVEWYETDNHMWVITELCTGGTLNDILVQDGHLPEPTIRQFASYLVSGLNYVHSMGLIMVDINPNKILLDTNGVLKFYDFSHTQLPAGVSGIKELLAGSSSVHHSHGGERYSLAGLSDDSVDYGLPGNPLYLAPELLLSQPGSEASDLWSVGCHL